MKHMEHLMRRYPELRSMEADILNAFAMIRETYEKGGKLLICGNGGSASDADHIVGELMKGFYLPRRLPEAEQEAFGELGRYLQGALPAIALTQHAALSTAFLNDVEPFMVFAQQVYGYGQAGDLLLCLSTSGNSRNVINAARVGKARGLKILSMTGKDGGELKDFSDICLIVPADITADIQEYHLPIYHALCAMTEDAFFGEEQSLGRKDVG